MSQTKAQLVQPVGVFTGTGINVTGVITATSFVGSGEGLTGVASTDNIITGTASTFNNTVNVNSSLNATRLNVTGVTTSADAKILTGFTTNATNTNLKVTGVGTFAGAVTAASFSGDGSGLTGVANTGFINAEQLTVVGVVTAATGNVGNVNITKSAAGAGATVGSYTGVTTYYGDGQYLSGVGLSVAPWNYNPDINDVNVAVDTGIGITFNTKVVAGSGTATLKIVNAGVAGTTVQSWGISSFTQSAVQEITLGALVSDLTKGNTYQLDIPEGFVTDSGGTNYVGTAWTFAPAEASLDPWTSGELYSWGPGYQGQTGLNNETNYSSPVQITGGGNTWTKLGRNSYYANHTCAIKSDNTLWVWGGDGNGELGQGGTTQYSSPVQVPGTSWAACCSGGDFMMAVRTDGNLYTWGHNGYGQLGHNNKTDYSSPKQVPGSWRYSDMGGIAAGAYHAMAIRTDGTLYTWGYNNSGGLGHNNKTGYSSPKQIPGTTWQFCAADIEKGCAIKTDGTLWGWGKNQHGQACADNSTVYKSSPIQIPGTWSQAALGDDLGGGIKTDGTLWMWGLNNWGTLGQNSTSPGISSPVQVGGMSNWSTSLGSMDCGANNLLAVNSAGALFACGLDSNGDLGINGGGPSGSVSSPTQVSSKGGWEYVICQPTSGMCRE